MAEKIDPRDLTSEGSTDVEHEMREFVERVLKQPKIPTMGKKLIVEASTPGHFPGLLWERFIDKTYPQGSTGSLRRSRASLR